MSWVEGTWRHLWTRIKPRPPRVGKSADFVTEGCQALGRVTAVAAAGGCPGAPNNFAGNDDTLISDRSSAAAYGIAWMSNTATHKETSGALSSAGMPMTNPGARVN